jgi:hypothetical protein
MTEFDTSIGDELLILGEQVIIGTAMLGNDLGTVKTASVKRVADKLELEGGSGNLRAFVLLKPGFELVLECAFERHVQPPGLLDVIQLPLVGVAGRVMPGVEVKWEQGKERGITIPVSQWDSLIGVGAFRLNPVTEAFTSLDGEGNSNIHTADTTQATADTTQITCDRT